MAAIVAGMPVETAAGLVLTVSPHVMAPGEPLSASHAAGLLLWLGCMVTGGAALAVLLVQWGVHDTRRADDLASLLARGSRGAAAGGAGPG